LAELVDRERSGQHVCLVDLLVDTQATFWVPSQPAGNIGDGLLTR
jgi:hypothetical protein